MKVKAFISGRALVYVMHATRAGNVNQKKYYALVKRLCGQKGLEDLIRLRMGILPGQGYMGYPGGYLEGRALMARERKTVSSSSEAEARTKSWKTSLFALQPAKSCRLAANTCVRSG